MTVTYYPSGVALGVSLDNVDEPLLGLLFQIPEGVFQTATEDVEIVLTEQEAVAMVGILHEGLLRAAVLREMLTMFPEQREAILTNVLFRWTGEVDDGSTA